MFPIHGTCLGFQLLHILEANVSFTELLVDTDSGACCGAHLVSLLLLVLLLSHMLKEHQRARELLVCTDMRHLSELRA